MQEAQSKPKRKSYRTYKAFEIPPSRLHTRPPARHRDTVLVQGQVPRPIYDAARDKLSEDHLAWAHVLRWALLEYIRTHDQALSDELANKYH